MSYQVLARKWRPRDFSELKGQEHVSRALMSALESGRLHHAYLFTGTRGVGKTTIARILAKCLNCEKGVTVTPCGQCTSCVEIDEGRFVDLIEVDAASRTKVDDTRELLENVQYRPTRGRYKVYLIDEVHMLSGHSFNALLKTLEEPPEHVIFLLATTDPQKLPVTVLSRCLQFYLKHMPETVIRQHLDFILGQENITYEADSTGLIARSADGSMRDALSLLDQAIAFGHGSLTKSDVKEMLGTVDHHFIDSLLAAIEQQDAGVAMAAVEEMARYSSDFQQVLNGLLDALHQVALFQATGVALDNSPAIEKFAGLLTPEDVQLAYQLGLHARRDLEFAVTPRQGLEMALLRMIAFKPLSGAAKVSRSENGAEKKKSPVRLPASDKSDDLTQQEPRSEAAASLQAHRSTSAPSENLNTPPEAGSATTEAEVIAPEARPKPPTPDRPEESTSTELPAETPDPGNAQESSAPRPESRGAATLPESVSDARDPALASLHAALSLSSGAEPSRKKQSAPVEKSESRLHSSGTDANLLKPAARPVPPAKPAGAAEEGTASAVKVRPDPNLQPASMSAQTETVAEPAAPVTKPEDTLPLTAENWYRIVAALNLTGTARQLAVNGVPAGMDSGECRFTYEPAAQAVATDGALSKLTEALEAYYGKPVTMTLQAVRPEQETPIQRNARILAENKAQALATIARNPHVQGLKSQFGAEIQETGLHLCEQTEEVKS